MNNGYPVVSIDCKKKENIGGFKNVGAEYAPQKQPVKVLDHDFPLLELGKAAPLRYFLEKTSRNGIVKYAEDECNRGEEALEKINSVLSTKYLSEYTLSDLLSGFIE